MASRINCAGAMSLTERVLSFSTTRKKRTPTPMSVPAWTIKVMKMDISPSSPPIRYPKALATLWMVAVIIRLVGRSASEETFTT